MAKVKYFFNSFIILIHFFGYIYSSGLSGSAEYCLMEAFQPQCRPNEVIVMKSAMYGRMKVGKCIVAQKVTLISKDETTLGCYSDVLSIMDSKCSGRTKCEVRIPDNELESTKPCNLELKMYLEAEYECIQVLERDQRSSCSLVATATFQYIKLAKSQNCGSASKPWVIETTLGKTIELSMYDFRSPKPLQNSSRSFHKVYATCSKMGVINDKHSKKQETICDSYIRKRMLFSSSGNSVEISMDDTTTESDKIFLGFKAIGCSDIIPSEDSWMKRDGNSLTVGCYSSRKTWTLTCQHDKWIGTIGNCSHEIDLERNFIQPKEENTEKIIMSVEHQTLVIVAIVGFGIVVCLTIICAGFICVNKCYGKKSSFDRKLPDESDPSNGIHYYNKNLGLNYLQDNKTVLASQCNNMSNNSEHYEESKYFILDEEASRNQNTSE